MKNILLKICNHTITISLHLLFFLIPLLLTPINFELFEYNKMMAVYALTAVITTAWLSQMILNKELKVRRTPFDIPVMLFLISQIISTIFSIDRHVSIYGYYSRFNGGLVSIISYIILYYAFVSHVTISQIKKLLLTCLGSGLIVSFYGIAEHFGIDKSIWVQDVQNRVFSTLGQPNWLAAYLAVLIPITLGLLINSKSQVPNHKQIPNPKYQITNKFEILNFKNWSLFGNWILLFGISLIFYLTLIFTKSRSGFAAFWVANFLFWSFIFFKYKQTLLKIALIFNFSFLIFNFIFGTPFAQLNMLTSTGLFVGNKPIPTQSQIPPPSSSVLDTGITESGNIRRIVWKGAIDIMKRYPLFGSGVETFAFAYYQFRPVEHNMTSEWDFLYNKAHNEYLNYWATTGTFGLGTYLLFIGSFIVWFIHELKLEMGSGPPAGEAGKWDNEMGSGIVRLKKSNYQNVSPQHLASHFPLLTSLFVSWLTILITNFLGFSVVIIQIFFYLLPAMLVIIKTKEEYLIVGKESPTHGNLKTIQYIGVGITSLMGLFLIFKLGSMWFADVEYARGYNLSRSGNYVDAYQSLRKAINLNPDEPNYFDEISLVAAQLSVAAGDNKQTTLSAQLKNEAIAADKITLSISPKNVNYYKTQTRLYYALSSLDSQYTQKAIDALLHAHTLSPTDPKITYNLGLLYGRIGNSDEAIKYLKIAASLKPDYKDAHFALALLYKENKQTALAKAELEFILTKISTTDAETKKQLDELK